MNYYLISATTENSLNVLQRISSIFSRNRVNIETLNVSETAEKGVSHFSISINTSEQVIERVLNQLHRIIELIDVKITLEKTLVQSHANSFNCV